WRNKSKEVYEHSPTRLSISVNGFTVATQTVSSETSEATFNLNLDERIGFVEVHSEQNILLLAMDVEPPPDGTPEQFCRIDLSDDRSLELDMNFASAWPALTVIYRDPALKAATGASVAAEAAVKNVAKHSLDATISSSPPKLRLPAGTPDIGSRWTWPRRLLDLIPDGFWLRPSTITAALALILLAVLLLVRLPVTFVNAATLLDKASASEKLLLVAPDAVVHRTLRMETRDVTRNVLLSQRKIEIWRSSTPIGGKTSARRLY